MDINGLGKSGIYTKNEGEILGGGYVYAVYGPNGQRLYGLMTIQDIMEWSRKGCGWIGQFRYW